LSKKNGVKQEDKVNRRIGRTTEKYPSKNKLYEIDLQVSEDKTVVGCQNEVESVRKGR
jgi:hypothetical protein